MVWERVHSRQVPKKHFIHHLDGNPNNNRPENLVRMTTSAHTTMRKLLLQTRKKLTKPAFERFKQEILRINDDGTVLLTKAVFMF
ncbi:HNH endonuclease [Geobacter grbiciae]|uniref:HNH endonuclease n=1 Tax=Geobacter grbiciae TaxID=155042 RepID=UPI001C02E39F|nr:HNH endonuclease [Geobacter grbiciae]